MFKLQAGIILIAMFGLAFLTSILRKKRNPYSYIFLYLFTWLSFGCFYWGLATFSNHDSFIFEENIKLNSMAKSIYKKLGGLYKIDDIKKILKTESYNIEAINLEVGNNRNIAFTDRSIGSEWASLYTNYYDNRAYSHYSVKLIGAEENPQELMYFKPIEEIIFASDFYQSTILYKYQLTLYKVSEDSEKDIFKPVESENEMEALETIFIWSIRKINPVVKENEEIYYIPTSYGLHAIIEYSFSMPDQSIWSFKEVQLGTVPYPIIDFLYFSAVTLTTLGYGDILPNSSLTRAFVMLEALIGLILIGVFIARVLEHKDEK